MMKIPLELVMNKYIKPLYLFEYVVPPIISNLCGAAQIKWFFMFIIISSTSGCIRFDIIDGCLVHQLYLSPQFHFIIIDSNINHRYLVIFY